MQAWLNTSNTQHHRHHIYKSSIEVWMIKEFTSCELKTQLNKDVEYVDELIPIFKQALQRMTNEFLSPSILSRSTCSQNIQSLN